MTFRITAARFSLLPFLATAGLFPACAPLRPPVESSGSARSREGVEVALTRQGCSQNVDPDFHDDDLVEERVELQVRNPTADAITVRRDAFRLITPDGFALTTMTWRAADPLTLHGGETRTFELRYMTRGSLTCDGEMRLETDAGVRQNDRVVAVGSIRFRPRAAL